MKDIWNILNSIIKNGFQKISYPEFFVLNDQEEYNMDTVADGFNQFFVNVGPELAKTIPDPAIRTDFDKLVERNPHSMFLSSVNEGEVLDIVRNFRNKKSTDDNDIVMFIIKTVMEGISKPLTYICNLSFQTGTFPNKMETAKVIPLYKSGDKHSFTNYHPVSLLPQFSKILEKIFNNRLDTFILKHNLLTDSQYGFRTNSTTSLALIDSIENVMNSIEQKQFAVGLFIDLKKAFDTIDHHILINKLEHYGIRGVVLNWIQSYLSDRRQFVKLGDSCSKCLDITCGVPQGSILGPKFFILYINDICHTSKILKLVLFADVTNIFCSGDDLHQLQDLVNTEMMKLKTWFDKNKLSLNVNKTKVMFGHRRRHTQIKILRWCEY